MRLLRFMKDENFSIRLLSFEILRYIILLVFLYTFYHKIIDLEVFEKQLLRSKLIFRYVGFLKYGIPFIELITVVILFFDRFILIGLYLSFSLLSLFTVYLVALNEFSLFYGCSCGGVFNELSFNDHLIVNLTLLIFNVIAIFLFKKSYR